ncbi:piggyBac transposable element-derived protein 4-like [Stegodyphus dumicola]|uniref:piggyBac transposable element-derived protein 4-like n=1 Tax=Stegodyphus dumicola TaxID=202533 RepID=UPI0015AE91CC|nr:piggyBac transposable element-derived protein 4-like [Stegodyphus dumicola]
MPCNRFCEIHKFLHFADNEAFDCNTHTNPKLHKIWPVLQPLNELFQRAVTPGRDIVSDETLMLFKGRLGWRQYMLKKRSHFEVKSYLLCESSLGYIWSQIIYTGKGTVFEAKYIYLSQSIQVVMSLTKPLLKQGYCLITDNFYTSPELAYILLWNCKTKPKRNASRIKKRESQKVKMLLFVEIKVLAMKWKDEKDVTMLSTVHTNHMVDVQCHNKVVKKPNCQRLQ